ncbi:MAG: DUF2807 domain-containing protein [Hymenobacteraceae bacterium]|nr:DUF2807 domain-containing protein [Hymenobacteraceae bacterium]MDX5396763.1 DUF2807 domain-containing protein [Hymenobacteraceae bacterium]MDX5512825.1 DUF2807 domain-containing protein [Hymenobacteraceae bacterium]
MKRILLLTPFFTLLLTLAFVTDSAAQKSKARSIVGRGDVITAKRKTGDFAGIDVKGNFDIIVTFGKRPEMRIEAYENLEENIVTDVQENMLLIGPYRSFTSDTPVKIYLTVNRLEQIRAKGGAVITIEENLTKANTNAEALIMDIRSGAKVDITLDSLAAKAKLFENGQLYLKGNTPNLIAEVEGNSVLAAGELAAERVWLRARSGSSAKIIADKELDVAVSEGATVFYRGRPDLKQEISSGGKLRRL